MSEKSGSFPLSVVILARNEESNIVRCVEAVQWCNDIVVIDDHSTDRTAEFAMYSGARVLQHPFEDFAAQRNWAMEGGDLKNDWVLHLDADEVVTPELRTELIRVLSEVRSDLTAFRMCRKTMLGTKWLKYSDGFPVWIMRLVKNGRAAFRSSGHGEIAVPPIDGTLGTISVPFLHFAFSKGWSNWIDRHNRYSSREAELEFAQATAFSWTALLSVRKDSRRAALRQLSRRVPCRSLLRFIYQYVLKWGFLDGTAGFTFCRMMAQYEGWIILKRNELRSRRHQQVR